LLKPIGGFCVLLVTRRCDEISGNHDPKRNNQKPPLFAVPDTEGGHLCRAVRLCPLKRTIGDRFLLLLKYSNRSIELACLLLFVLFPTGDNMRTYADTEVQARLIREMRELYEKRGKLEAGIRAVDTARTLRIENDALRDIAAYRALLSRSQAM
jgi:hypothetical protein